MFQSPAEEMLFAQHVAPVSSTTGTYGITGTAVDLSGWDGVLFLLEVGAMVAAGTFDAKAQSAAASAFGTPHDLTNGGLVQLIAATGASKLYAIDVKTMSVINQNAADRYARIAAQTDGTHAVVLSITSILYRRSGAQPPAAPAQLIKV